MNNFVEVLYLLFAFFLILGLCVILTSQIFYIYQVEQNIYTFLLSSKQKVFSEFFAYTMSQLHIKKCRWIEAIQILQSTLKQKQLHDKLNKYSLVSLCNALSYLYNKAHQHAAATYYVQLACSFNNNRDSRI